MEEVEAQWPGDDSKKRVCSLIEEGGAKAIRMANLAVVGSHAVNGVAALHTELLKRDLFPSSTNYILKTSKQNQWDHAAPVAAGEQSPVIVAPRKNAGLVCVGDATSICCGGWRDAADDAAFQREFMAVKHANKVDLAAVIKAERRRGGFPDALFDVQIKRHSRIQAPAFESAAHPRALSPAAARIRAWRWFRGSSFSAAKRRRATSCENIIRSRPT